MSQASNPDKYYVPEGSWWPLVSTIALFVIFLGAALTFNLGATGSPVLVFGFLLLLVVFVGWFGVVIRESENGLYNSQVDISFRMGMLWFIFSEVMFFAAFFGALFYARVIAMPWLGDIDHRAVLWPDFIAQWPNTGPAQGVFENFQVMGPFWVPTINTALLLSSGVTLTLAHHYLREHNNWYRLWLYSWSSRLRNRCN